MEGGFQVRRRARLANGQTALTGLPRLDRSQARRLRTRWDMAEIAVDLAQRRVGLDVTDDDERGVVGDVVAAVVAVQIVPGHRLEVGDPADGRVPVGVRLERRRGQLLIEELVGIVLAALELRDDDGALGLAVVRVIQAVAPSARIR